ncbi:MAG: hypothetical protein IM613_13650 [Cytophagales bacterium]|nr:hypothetical protein [Cytophagales bacterium]
MFNNKKVEMIGEPGILIMQHCRHCAVIEHRNLQGDKYGLCLKPTNENKDELQRGNCTCMHYGKVLMEDRKPGFNGNDPIDNFTLGSMM